MIIPADYMHIDVISSQIKKRFGLLTVISSISYFILSVSYLVALIVAYAVQKENCTIGLLLLPLVVWPSLFIFLLKFYAGFQFAKNKYGFKKFTKYVILFFVIEILYFILVFFTKAIDSYWYVILFLNFFFFIYITLHLSQAT